MMSIPDLPSKVQLPPEMWGHIASFLPTKDLVALSETDRLLNVTVNDFFMNIYQEIFGEIPKKQEFNPSMLLPIYLTHPNPKIDHNIYKIPATFLERWKWYLGVENQLDREVQENYDRCIKLVENTQPTSILQLKNKLLAFWHLDRQLKDYEIFKSTTQKNHIGAVFFNALGYLLKTFYNPSVITLGKKLDLRSQETFAKLGQFKHQDQDYEVIASHRLADEQSQLLGEPIQYFRSIRHGITTIKIVKKDQPHEESKYYLDVLLYWGLSNNKSFYTGEDCVGKDPVDHDQCRIEVRWLSYNDSTDAEEGSNRELDQKLTQIMVEMTMQNKNITYTSVDSKGDNLPVLVAAGFKTLPAERSEKVMQQVQRHRDASPQNNLFPPSRDYHTVATRFTHEGFTEKNVYYSRNVHYSKEGEGQSWSEIINNPILRNGSAVLPPFWAKPLNFVQQEEKR